MNLRHFWQHRAPLATAACLALASLIVLPGALVHGQETAAKEKQDKAKQEQAQEGKAKQSKGKGKSPVGIADVDNWESLSGISLSNDGKWFTSGKKSPRTNGTLWIKAVGGEKDYTFDTGSSSPSARFSNDSKYAVFTIGPPESSNSGGRGRGAAAGGASRASQSHVVLLNLADGTETKIENATTASFNGEDSTWLALRGGAAGGGGARGGRGGRGGRGPAAATGEDEEDTARGRDLVVYEIATGQRMNFGNVAEFAFNKSGQTLAMIVDASGKAGNGIVLRDMASGVTRQIESAEASYRSLNWTEEGDALCALKGVDDDDYEEPLYSVVAFRDLNAATPTKVVYDPQSDDVFPAGMTVSPNAQPRWNKKLDVLLFGIADAKMTEAAKKREAEASASDKKKDDDSDAKQETKDGEETQTAQRGGRGGRGGAASEEETSAKPASLVIWHWKDPRMQSAQQVQEGRDKSLNYASMYRVKDDKFVRLEDDEIRNVMTAPLMDGARYVVGVSNDKYELDGNLSGQNFSDIYLIDTYNGKRRLALEKCRWFLGVSPEGDKALYFQDGHYQALDLASGESMNITKDVPSTFWDEEDDHNVDRPPVRPMGWVKGGACVLLSDSWDVWCVPIHGGAATNLTQNGKTDAIRYTRMAVEEEEDGIDLTHPQYFATYGEWTKKSGFSLVDNGTPGAQQLAWEDCDFGGLQKAEDADVFCFMRQTYTQSPICMVASNNLLKDPKQMASANDNNNGFAWSSGVRLIDYSSDKGDKLQASLYLPANYEEGKRYPTIVYIYEKLSQGLHTYSNPRVGGFSPSFYTSQGYAVLEPDIVYTINDPGMSAVWCVLPALTAAVDSGVVDGEHVAIHGHSWGGYQTAYLITQTDRFACAIAGAPLTNMISMYSSIYWNSGSANQPIFESSQGRFAGGYLENMEAYTRNSPVYFANQVTTPLMLLHNDKDGAVDWNQGIEYFNTLRRLKKPVVMLEYVGENHGVAQPDNRRDYSERMLEFFNHYLKGEEAPAWLAEGIPHLDIEQHLKDRTKASNEALKQSKAAAKQVADAKKKAAEKSDAKEDGEEKPAAKKAEAAKKANAEKKDAEKKDAEKKDAEKKDGDQGDKGTGEGQDSGR